MIRGTRFETAILTLTASYRDVMRLHYKELVAITDLNLRSEDLHLTRTYTYTYTNAYT